MPIEVKLPDGSVAKFPDGLPKEEMERSIRARLQEAPVDLPVRAAGELAVGTTATIAEPEAARGPLPPVTSPAFPQPGGEFEPEQPARATGAPPAEPVFEGAPPSARFLAGLGADEEQARLGVELGLQRAFGRQIETRLNAKTGELEFKNPETDDFIPINPSGISLGDLAAFGAQLVAIAPEVAGGIAGSALSPTLGTLAFGALGAFFGEMMRLRFGQLQGINETLTDDEIVNQALRAGGFSALTGTAANTAFRLGRAVLTRVKIGGAIPKSVLRAGEDVEEALEESKLLSAQVKERTGKDLPLTSGQALRSDELLEAERFLAKRPGGEPIKEVLESQEKVLGELETVVKDPFSTRSGIQQTGRKIQSAVAAPTRKAISRLEAGTESARREAAETAAIATRGQIPPSEAGDLAQEALETGRDATQKAFRQRYNDLDAQAAGAEVELESFRAAGQKWKGVVDEDLLPSLTAEDVPVIAEATRAGIRPVRDPVTGTIAKDPLTKEPLEETFEVPFSAVQRTLSSLREELRLMRKGVSPRRDTKAMQELHDALLADRDAALANRPELQRIVDNLEASYAEAKSAVDRSLIGKLIDKAEGGGFKLRSEKVIGQILASPSGAKEVARVISDPKYAAFAGARDPIRRGILGRYMKEVVDPETGIANISSHRRFIRDNSPSMRQFFSLDEMARLQRPGSAAVFLKQTEILEKRLVAQLNKSFRMKLERFDSSAVVDELFKPNKLDDIDRIRRILRSDLTKWKDFQGQTLRKVWQDISVYDTSAGQYRLSAQKMTDWLQPRQATMLAKVHGPEFVRDFKVLRNAYEVVQRTRAVPSDEVISEALGGRRATALDELLRVYFRPLSQRGKALTAAKKLRGKAAERVMVRALADPQELARLVRLAKVSAGSKAASVILGQMGGTLLTTPEEIDVSPEAVTRAVDQRETQQPALTPALTR